jgi:WD40 repeat protein/serine/threonine protein kinase
MKPAPDQIASILAAAVEMDSEVGRREFLVQACAGDAELIRRVEELLENHFHAGSFLESPATDLLIAGLEGPGTVIGPYKLLEQIGEGGFGVVFMAEQQQPVRRKVALKVLKPGMDTKQVVARFEAERQALALMNHPHIAHVLDAGATDTGRPYFVMELIRGIPITQFCDDNRLTPPDRLELFLTVCQAMQHAHQKGIIHRDLKPSNVLVTLLDGKPLIKVIDFGIAKAIGQERLTDKTLFTGFALMIGTPLYMSPEQAEMSGQDVDTRTDIYALGVLLYELLTGTTPFDKDRLKAVGYDEIRRIIREEEPAKPSARISTLGQAATTVSANRKSEPRRLSQLFRGELDWLVMKALEKDRNRRYESASALAADVQHYLHDEPVQACPPSTGYRLRKSARKYRLPIIVVATIALLLVAGVVASAWQALRARTAEARYRSLYYAASMGAAETAWDNHNIAHLRNLLDDTRDLPERGFEWLFWQRLCHLQLQHLTLVGHKGSVAAVAFSADGQQLVTGGNDGTARVWNATSGQELLCLMGHCRQVTSVAFAPDGKWLVTGSTDDTTRVWDAVRGREIRLLQDPTTGPVWAVAVMPDGKRVVTGNEDGTARIWDAASGHQLLTLRGPTPLPVFGVSLVGLLGLPQGRAPLLAAAVLYPGSTGHTGRVWSVAVSSDGRRLLTGSGDGTARVWDTATGRELLTPLQHDCEVTAVAISADGQFLVTECGIYGEVTLWDATTGRELRHLGVSHIINRSIALTPDGKRVVSATKAWDTASGQAIAVPLWASCVASSPDGQRVATGNMDGTASIWETAKLWQARGGQERLTILANSGGTGSVAVTRDGQRIVTGSGEGPAKLWDAVSGRELLTLNGHTAAILSIAFTPDEQRIVTGSYDATARLWDAVDGHELRKFVGHSGRIWRVAATPDGERIVTGGEDGTARLWDALSGQELLKIHAHLGRVVSVAVTPDGQRLVTGGWPKTARVWDALRGNKLLELKGHTGVVTAIAVTRDGQRILTGSEDGTARLWDAGSGQELLTLKGHIGSVRSVAVTPDGQRIITGGDDNTARIWDTVNGRELLILKGHKKWVIPVIVTADGRQLITGSLDGTVKIWEAASEEQIALWTKQEQEAPRPLAAWQRPAAGAPHFIQDWLLVLAPLAPEEDPGWAETLEREQIQEEAKLQPREGDRVRVLDKEFCWQSHRGDEPVLDFNRVIGQVTNLGVAYAVCYVISERERKDLWLQVGSDDQAKVYLNGQEIYKSILPRGLVALDPIGPVTLRKGTNVLILKVVNEAMDWECCARFVDQEGNPAMGLRVSLTAE